MRVRGRFWSSEYWRIVLALAAKDIIDALKNKTTLTMILGLALMMLTVEALPLLLRLDRRPSVAIYDADRTGLADQLRQEGSVRVLEVRRESDARNAAREASTPLLSVILPAGWDSSAGVLRADAYVAHSVAAQNVERLTGQAEQALAATSGRQVALEVRTVYPTAESGGHTVMVALGLVLGVTLITTILVPYLILEEKTAHTLELLRVSPATITQVLLGKGLAGFVYGLLAASILLAVNQSLVNVWGLALPTLLGIVLFGVGLGLLVGTVVENEGAVQMWVALMVIVLMLPVLLAFFGTENIPEWISWFSRWLPTVATFDLLRLSFGNTWTLGEVWPRLAALLIAVMLVFGAAGWRLRAWSG